jgi:antitoxin component YwqK of YwqJK toxin-antitoxin module
MIHKNANIWIWLQNGKLMKAISCVNDGTLKIYDENDILIIKRTGLNKFQIRQIEKTIVKYGAKKLGKHTEPFKFFR